MLRYIILIAAFVASAVLVNAKESCVERALLAHLGKCPRRGNPCRDTCGDNELLNISRKAECDEYSDCCFRDGECIQLSSASNDEDEEISKNFEGGREKEENDRNRGDDRQHKEKPSEPVYRKPSKSRFRQEYEQHYQDETPITCNTDRFPYNCRYESYGSNNLRCLVNIPYCMRIPCFSAVSQHEVENSAIACTSNPGCCYDEELSLYRQHFGQRVLPGVPVCHYAVRNHIFQQHAERYSETFGGWNAQLTTCLIESQKANIFGDTAGCYMATVIEYFGLRAKQAGWKGISPLDCYLIDGCYRPDRGCVYPFDPTKGIKLRPNDPSSKPTAPHDGFETPSHDMKTRFQCQEFKNMQDPIDFLTTYHQCLSSGCSLEPKAQDLYMKQLWNVSQMLGPRGRDPFWKAVMSYDVRADNVLDELNKYKEAYDEPDYDSPLVPLGITPTLRTPAVAPLPFGMFQRQLTFPQAQLPSASTCAFAKPVVPNFPPLTGSFEGCCEKPLCYFSAQLIQGEQVFSELTYYYSAWSAWSKCSASCGGGKYRRIRRCVSHNEVTSRDDCEGQEDIRPCNTSPCPHWGQWSEYGACSATCAGGRMMRQRRCIGARACYGRSTETAVCGQGKCAVATTWTQWSACSTTCGKGYQARTRRCIRDCTIDFKASDTRICFMYCGNIVWGPWSKCNEATCTMERTASCKYGQVPGFCKKDVPAPAKTACTRNPCYCRMYPTRCRQAPNAYPPQSHVQRPQPQVRYPPYQQPPRTQPARHLAFTGNVFG